MRGTLVVEDGTTAEGVFFGSDRQVFGELVFNTNMTGYTEALTDPSYRGQILMMTYPLIGNYGVDPASMESREIQVSGFVVKEACPTPVHPRSAMGVDRFLEQHGRPGLSGVDTRMLTIKTRTRGTMRAALVPEGGDVEAAMKEVRTMPFPDARNLVAECSTREPVEYPGPEARTFVVIDCGVKMNIIREAQRYGRVVQLPYGATPEDVARHKPSGVIISNGPGDPAHPDITATAVKTAKEIAAEYPILGICLGHQILGLAFGGRTYKLKFGHRGGNQPVKDLRTGRVHITSQNHGFAVDAKSMEASEFDVTHVNLNDDTVEGMIHKELPVFSVQYHPEARPGPWDNEYIFREFAAMAGR
ncbi:MAG TPA: glutamine-hydrolyzing carbamoyl-phosphate synthase small subunit [Thermoplasmata archaeon]